MIPILYVNNFFFLS